MDGAGLLKIKDKCYNRKMEAGCGIAIIII